MHIYHDRGAALEVNGRGVLQFRVYHAPWAGIVRRRHGGRRGDVRRLHGRATPRSGRIMTAEAFTLFDDDQCSEVSAVIEEGRIRVAAPALARATGWELKPEGLCNGPRCVPIRDRTLVSGDGVDLVALATALGRPIAVDVEERMAVLGAAAANRGAALASLEAPDFALPDLAGRVHRLSDYRGKKVLLVAYASW